MGTYVDTLSALSDPTRRQVFELLRKAPASVGELAAQLPVSRPAVSQHLRALRDAGLVEFESAGTRHVYSIDTAGLRELRMWIDSFWDEALDRYRDAFEREWGYRP